MVSRYSGASVELTDVTRGLHRTAVTNESGNYVIPGLSPGQYSLKVAKEGFTTYTYNEFSIEVNQRATIDVRLSIGDLKQVVNVDVHGEAPLLETDSNALGSVIDNRRVEELPLNGRNFLQLAVLSGGVEIPPLARNADRASSQTGHSSRTINIGGNPESVTTYLVDGIATRGSRLGESSLNLSVSDIDQFKLQMNFFMPDQGPNPGNCQCRHQSREPISSMVNCSSLSATVRWMPETSSRQRRSSCSAISSDLHLAVRFTFRSCSMERTGCGSTAITRAHARSRNLQARPTHLTPRCSAAISARCRSRSTIPSATTRILARALPFPGNKIPAALINPVAKALLPYYVPGSSVNQRPSNYFGQPRNTLNDDQFSIRGDYAISQSQSLAVNTLHENSPAIQGSLFPLAGALYPLAANGSDSAAYVDHLPSSGEHRSAWLRPFHRVQRR